MVIPHKSSKDRFSTSYEMLSSEGACFIVLSKRITLRALLFIEAFDKLENS
jgi:hypothetical protein